MYKKKLFIYLFVTILFVLAFHTEAQAQEYDTIRDESLVAPIGDSTKTNSHGSLDDTYQIKRPKGSFKEINEKEIALTQQRKVPDTSMVKLRKDDAFWYVDAVQKPEEKQEGFWEWLDRLTRSKTTKIVIWSVLGLLMLAAIIFYLKDNQIGFFASSSKKIKNVAIEEGDMPENIFEIDYESAINQALAINNYRLATRFLFLRSLKDLSSKKIIEYGADKTNFDYLFQISGTKYYTAFVHAVKHYEYLWYGNFAVNSEQYNSIQKGFDDFQQQLA